METEKKRLYRSRTDRMVGGVCGGMAAYLNVDATIVRLVVAVLALVQGVGVVLYLLGWILIPAEGRQTGSPGDVAREGAEEMAVQARSFGDSVRKAVGSDSGNAAVVVGIVLVLVGVVFLLRSLGIVLFGWVEWGVLWPILLIGAGVVLLLRHRNGG